MAGVMPSLSQPISPTLGGDYLRQMAAGDLANTKILQEYRGDQMKNYTDLSKTMLSSAGNLADVFGGGQTGAMMENVLGSDVWGVGANGETLQPLAAGGLSGDYTGQMDALRLTKARADIASAGRRGGGGGGGGGKGASVYLRNPATGEIIGFSNATAAGAAPMDFEPYLPNAGDEYTYYSSSGVKSATVGGDAVSGGAPTIAEPDPAASYPTAGEEVDEEDPQAIVDQLRANGWENAVVIGGEPTYDGVKPYYER